MLRKDVQFEWTDECNDTFQILKQKLTTAPILAFPDMNKPYILSTDASGSAIGYVLSQLDDKSSERVIAYGGRALRGNELKFPIYEKECLALVEAVKQYHPYLSLKQFTVYTDSLSSTFIQQIKKTMVE